MKQFLAILGVFFLLSAFTVSNAPSTIDGHTLPAVNVKTMEGKSVNIQDLVGNGKITVISFWATWCSPCKRELDAIADIYPDWQEEFDVELLAVTIDDARGVAKVPAKPHGGQVPLRFGPRVRIARRLERGAEPIPSLDRSWR